MLSDVYLSCNTGDIVGLFGRNGSGKSTFLKIVFGSLSVDNKHITIDKKKLDKPFSSKNAIGFLPQNQFIPNYLKVKTSVNLFIENHQKINLFIDDIVINKIRGKKINELSFGELRYLEIKILLYSENKFILPEEPFQGLSPIYVEKIKDLILDSKRDKGIIITDHNYSQVLEIVNKLYMIKEGTLFF
ncbi:ATP-binding cassette domain-containing protein [Flavobacterium columnare]|uniref:ATP-binding cassette domain-containing protein n=1 Tax=Flavobacterium columnare TaxID=996 RepID=A0A437UBI8_9FLAO|nr:ATP-binding cassette domain-containing protein [Flavobacterium columnare]RVU90945.1 ATP-binding cassette domain-containing protein [Flavobacterium columnare]